LIAGEERELKLILNAVPQASGGSGWAWWLAGAGVAVLGASAIAFAVASPFSSRGGHDCLCITTAASPCARGP
jgi:hypothetical protein